MKQKCKDYRNNGKYPCPSICHLCKKEILTCGAHDIGGDCNPDLISDSCCINCIIECKDREVEHFEKETLLKCLECENYIGSGKCYTSPCNYKAKERE
jgi:hypothetical protein